MQENNFKFKAGSINVNQIGLGKSYKNSVLIKTKKQEKLNYTIFTARKVLERLNQI